MQLLLENVPCKMLNYAYAEVTAYAYDEQFHTNSQRRWSSTSAILQSAENDRSALSTGQLWSSVTVAGPSTWNSL